MKVLAAALLLAAAFCICASADDAVITLTSANFDSVVDSADLILVEFYAPWCGHCKRLAPEYEKAAQTLKNNDPPIPLAKVDATEEEELGRRFEVRGYPTLYIFRKGKKFEYDGPREADGIVSYMKKQAGPASRPLASVDAVQSFTADEGEKVVFVAFFDSADAPELAAFRAVAESLRTNYKFGEVVDKSVGSALNHNNRIVAFKKFDDKEAVFQGPATESAITSFVRVNSVPQFGQLTAENASDYSDSGLPVVFLYFDVDFDKNVKRTNYFTRRLEKVAGDYKGKVVFVYADKEALHDPSRFGATGTEESVLVIEDFGTDAVYKFTDTFNVDNVKKFVDNFLAGNLKPHVKSEPVPESNDGPVKVVVGQTFNDIVMDDSKDVLIEFYAPWCGHCKSLAPVYEELGKKVKDVSSLVIAKIDATANDWPKNKFQVTGYPTIYFKPAHGGAIKRYDGGRDVDSFVDFLKKSAAVEFSLTQQKDEL